MEIRINGASGETAFHFHRGPGFVYLKLGRRDWYWQLRGGQQLR